MFKEWDGVYYNAKQVNNGYPEFKLNEDLSGGNTIYGNGSVRAKLFANISEFTKIEFKGTPGLKLRVLFNRTADNSNDYIELNPVIGDDGVAQVSIVDFEYVHLNAIKAGFNLPEGSHQVTEINLIKEDIVNTLPTHYYELQPSMYKEWNSADGTATESKDASCSFNIGISTGQPYGEGSVGYLKYADLTRYDKLEVTVSSGVPRFLFNRLENEASSSDDVLTTKLIEIPNKASATERYQTVDGNIYTINLKQITEDRGFAHLNAIKGASFKNVTVESMYLIIEHEQIEITDAGLATFASEYALDFTNAQKIAAYKATINNGVVNLEKVTTVAAGEGVLLRSVDGGAVTESIPYADDDVSENSGNEFLGTLNTIALPSQDNEYKYYILGYTEAGGYGFYLANNKKIAKGKAYIRVANDEVSSSKMNINVIDGETTGIENVETIITNDVATNIYDLSGRIVKNPVKGLYIMNGKKYIVK